MVMTTMTTCIPSLLQNYSSDKVMQLKDYIMKKYDKNRDQKLDITEVRNNNPSLTDTH